METFLSGFSGHGYTVLLLAVFLESVGLPVPAALALMVAGATAGTGKLSLALAFGGSVLAMQCGDMLMFLLGRYTGWWLLGKLCRLSLNPDSCILKAADAFFRRGRTVLLFAKFIPGINTMAPPLAGSMNMRFPQFVLLDLAGTVLYIGTYLSVGFLFSETLEAITSSYRAASDILGLVILIVVGAYLAYRAWILIRNRGQIKVSTVDPAEIADALDQPTTLIFDVRSHGYYDARAERIRCSRRLDPNALHQTNPPVPSGYRVYLYCTCIQEATSAQVAHELRKQGIEATVIRGGLKAWKKAGLPVETVPLEEVSPLPVFEQ